MPLKTVFLILCSLPALANQRYSNWCEQGNKTVVTSGVSGAPKVQGSYPQCQVNVYLAGTLTHATIFSDNSATPLANPFTAQTTGLFFFYAANGRYDVTISGGGLPAPFTFGDQLLADPFAGAGTVSSWTGNQGTTRQNGVVAINGDYTLRMISNVPFLSSTDFNFTSQAPGVTLTAGIGASITLVPCPLGVSGTHTVANNLPHLLYISGGTGGAAEAVAITGGTCTGNGTSNGTIQFTPANGHGGGWTLQSNTTGVQEAIYVAGANGSVRMSGTVILQANTATRAALTIPDGYATSVRGTGNGSTIIRTGGTTGDWMLWDFVSTGGLLDCGDFEMVDNAGVRHTTGSMIRLRNRTDGQINNIYMAFAYDGVVVEASRHGFYHDLYIDHGHYGFFMTCNGTNYPSCQNQGTIYSINVNTQATNANAVRIEAPTTGVLVDNIFTGSSTNTNNVSVVLVGVGTGTTNPLNEITVQNSFIDGHSIGVQIIGNASAYNTNGIMIHGNRIQASIFGLLAQSFVENLTVANNYIVGITGGVADRSVVFSGDVRKTQLINNQLGSDGDACILIQNTGAGYSDLDILGNTCGRQSGGLQPTSALILGGTISNLNVKGNWFSGSAANALGVINNTATITGLNWTGNTGSVSFPFSAYTACGTGLEGQTALVSDSTTTTWGAVITGGGASHVMGVCNGTNWTVMGK